MIAFLKEVYRRHTKLLGYFFMRTYRGREGLLDENVQSSLTLSRH